MSSSLKEQLEICRKTLDGLDEAGAKIDRLAQEYHQIVEVLGRRGYLDELLVDLRQMESEFLEQVSRLKRQLFEENMAYVHSQGAAIKDVLSRI